MRPITVLTVCSLTVGAVLGAACGGGDGGTEPPPPPPANRAPVAVGSIAGVTLMVGDEVTTDVAGNFSDPDGDALTYSASTSAAGVATATVSGSQVTVAGVAAGTATITITARDPGGLTATQTMGVTVETANRAPVAKGTIDAVTLEEGQQATVDVAGNFSDPDGDALEYVATSSDTAVATVSMSEAVATVSANAPGSATVTVTATDPGGLSATQTFTVTVEAANRAPEAVDSIPPQTLAPGDTVHLDLSSHFSDPDGDELTYSATTSAAEVATAAVSGSQVAVAGVAPGTATVTITASDPGGLTATQTTDVTVATANRAPVAEGTIDDLTMEEGAEVAVDVAGNFSDPDGDALEYAATSSDATVATVSLAESVATVSAIAQGSATVTVTATDPGGLSATHEFTVTVGTANRAPVAEGTIDDLTMEEGAEVAVDVAGNFSDPDGDALEYAATSSDATVATVSLAESVATVSAIATGSATVTVTATDPGGLSATQEFTVTVEPANHPPEIADSIPPQTLAQGDTVRLDASRHFSDPDGDALSYEAVSSDAGIATALATDAVVEIRGEAAGSTFVTVTAVDPKGQSAAQRVMVTVEPPPPTVGDTIPTHDMIVDSMVPLDVAPYFAGGDLTYSVTVSDETIAVASVDGSTVTTTGVGAVEDSVSVATLSVTATNASGSVTQDSIMVRVHQEEYDSLPGLSVTEDGKLTAQLGNSTLVLSFCLQLKNFPVGDLGAFTVFWSEWQRAVGGGWVTAQDNNKAHIVGRNPDGGGSMCPIRIEDEAFPPGIYRLVGHVQIDDDSAFYKSPTFEKKPEG